MTDRAYLVIGAIVVALVLLAMFLIRGELNIGNVVGAVTGVPVGIWLHRLMRGK